MTNMKLFHLPAIITNAKKQSVKGILKRLSKTKLIVASDVPLPRDSYCELMFTAALPSESSRLIRILCIVEETVLSSIGVDIHLKVDRFLNSHSSDTLNKLASV